MYLCARVCGPYLVLGILEEEWALLMMLGAPEPQHLHLNYIEPFDSLSHYSCSILDLVVILVVVKSIQYLSVVDRKCSLLILLL